MRQLNCLINHENLNKKLLVTLWIIIFIAGGFLTYNYIAPKAAIDTAPTDTNPNQNLQFSDKDIKDQNFSNLLAQGDKFFEEEGYKDALTYYMAALKKYPESGQTLYKTGLTYLADNNPEKARGYFEQLKTLSKTQDPRIDVLIGRTYLNQRKAEEAKKYFESLSYDNEDVKYYRAIIDILYKNHDKAKEALKSLTSEKAKILMNAYNDFDANRGGLPAHRDTILGKALIDVKEYESAIQVLFNAINTNNGYRDAWILLGYSYLKTEKYPDALDSLLQAKTIDPEKPETLFFLGMTYSLQNRYEDAAFYFKKAKTAGFEPQIQVIQKLADSYMILKDYENAVSEYSEIIDINPEDLTIFTKAIWICIEKINKPQRAIGLAEQALKAHPDNAISYNLLGWSFVAYGDYERGKENLEKALTLNPDLADAYLNIGWMFEKQEDLDSAAKYYEKAYELGKNTSVANIALVRLNNLNTIKTP